MIIAKNKYPYLINNNFKMNKKNNNYLKKKNF